MAADSAGVTEECGCRWRWKHAGGRRWREGGWRGGWTGVQVAQEFRLVGRGAADGRWRLGRRMVFGPWDHDGQGSVFLMVQRGVVVSFGR